MNNFFGPGSPYLGHPLLTEQRTAVEVDRILSWCDAAPVDVLDMGCGFGRHSIELARRGFSVTGVDPSTTLLEHARRNAEAQGLAIDFVETGGAAFVRESSFDLAICLFTTLGQLPHIGAAPEVDAMLGNLRASLRPGGSLVIEVPERTRALANLVEDEQLGTTRVTRRFDATSGVLSERFETPDDTYDLAYQLLSKQELADAVDAAGFTVETIYDEAVFPPPETFMTVVAR